MFKKTRIKYDENTGVRTMEEYNPIKDTLQKFGAKTVEVTDEVLDFVGEHSLEINLGLGAAFLTWALGFKYGVDVTNKSLLESYKNDAVYFRGDGKVFKKAMKFSDWMDYLDHGYTTKKGWKTKNTNKYLKEKGFID